MSDDHVIEADDLYINQDKHDLLAQLPSARSERLPDEPLEQYLDKIEAEEIVSVLEESHWNRTVAAKRLGMSLRQLRYRMNKLDITE